MAELAHVHGQAALVAEVDIVFYRLGGGRTAVTVTGVHDVGVEGPVCQHVEVAVPAGAAQQDDVVGVGLPYGGHRAFVERLQTAVQLLFVVKIVGNGLVHQFIAQDDRLIAVAARYALPDVAEELLRGLALEEPGVAVAVVDVVAGLAAGAVVHVEYEVEARLAAPAHHIVYALETVLMGGEPHVVFIGEELVVEGQADGVGTLVADEEDVVAGDVVVLEVGPELCGHIGTHHLLEEQVYHPCRIGAAEAEHVAFGVEPVAQVGALDKKSGAVGFHQVVALDPDKLAFGSGCETQGKCQE